MTSRVVRMGKGHLYPGQLKEIIISCDQMGCTHTLNDTQIRDAGGLTEMGWETSYVSGEMRHYCPDHRRNKLNQE